MQQITAVTEKGKTMRAKLIEILRKPIFPHELVDPTEAVADYLLDSGVTVLPCKIGDTVWASGKQNGKPYIRQGVVSEMMYLEDMRLGIVVKFLPRYSHRGFWGVTIFATREECEAAIGGKDNERKAD